MAIDGTHDGIAFQQTDPMKLVADRNGLTPSGLADTFGVLTTFALLSVASEVLE